MFRIYSKVVKASGIYIEAYNINSAVGDHIVIKRNGDYLDGEKL